MSYYTVKKIYPWLYSICEPENIFCYLAVGDDKALLFDTGYGIAPLQGVISQVTDKPVTVALGHGHIDHVNGAFQFKEVWINEADFDLFREHSSEEYRAVIVNGLDKDATPEDFDPKAYIKATMPELIKMETGHVFDLGRLRLEAVAMEGHTPGSMGLLSTKHRVLLNSDSANNHIWMFLPHSLPLSQYITMLERTLKLDFDTFFTGHSDEPRPKSEMNKYIQVARNASFEKSKPYGMLPEFNGFLYQEDGVAIIFSEGTLC